MAHRKVSPQEALDLLGGQGYTYIDVRTEAEFEADRPAGALNIPVALHDPAQGMAPNADFVKVVTANFATDAKLVVGCKAGGRSNRAADLLKAAGFTDVADQRAGFDGARDANGAIAEPGWKPCGLPTETGPGGPAGYAALAKKMGPSG